MLIFKNKKILYFFYGLLFLVGFVATMAAGQSNQDTRSSAATINPTAIPPVPLISPALKSITGPDAVTGILNIQIADDFKNKKSVVFYSVKTSDGKNIKLNFSGTINAKSGSTVKALGRKIDSTTLEMGLISPANLQILLTAAKYIGSAPSTGNQKVAIIMSNFSDTNETYPSTAATANYFNGEVKNYFLENSFNNLTLTAYPIINKANPYGWYKLPIARVCDFETKIQEAAKAADADIYYPDYGSLIFIFPTNNGACPLFGSDMAVTLNYQSPDGNISKPAVLLQSAYAAAWYVFAHELGHTMGAGDANAWECGSQSVGDQNTCRIRAKQNAFDIMGNQYFYKPQFSPFFKNLFGWMLSSNSYKVTGSDIFTIYPSENKTAGIQLLEIPIPLSDKSYYIENREKVLSDSLLPDDATSGALIIFSNSSNHYDLNYITTNLIDTSPHINLTDNDSDNDFRVSALPVGSTYIDPTNGISIKALNNSGSALNVEVKLPTSVSLLSPLENFTYHANDPAMHFAWWPISTSSNYQLETNFFHYLNSPSYFPGYYRCGSLCGTDIKCDKCFYPLTSEDYAWPGCSDSTLAWRVNYKDNLGQVVKGPIWRNINCLPQITSAPTPIPVATGTAANISVQIGKSSPVMISPIPDNSAVAVPFSKDDGPVIVKSTNNTPIVVGIRERWNLNGVAKSTFQMLALPSSQVSTRYYFPAYNNVTLSEQLRIGNVDTVPTTVTVKIAGVIRGTYNLNANESTRQTYALDSGPVEVYSSGAKIIAAIRDAWLVNGQVTSFTELMGLPQSLLSDTYYFPAYNNVTLSGQLRIANADSVSTNVTVNIAGVDRGTYTLVPNQSIRPTFALDAGPVIVRSSNGAKIIAALRDAWLVNGQAVSFSQIMGLPKEQAADTYYFPWYENTNTVAGQLRIGNIGSAQTDVTVTIAGTEMGRYILKPNESVRPTYSNLNKEGPIEIKSSTGAKIIAAIRDVQISSSGTATSFTQTMGLPGPQLSTAYVLPAYNNVTLETELRIANPSGN